MKIYHPTSISNVTSGEDLQKYSSMTIELLVAAVNGNITFEDNVSCKIVTAEFTQANVDLKIEHGLSKVPNGYFATNLSAAMILYNGSTSFDDRNAYLRSSATGTAKILFF